MQVGKLKNRVIIRKVLVLLMCGAIGWYLKGKLTPQVPNMAAMGLPIFLLRLLILPMWSQLKVWI